MTTTILRRTEVTRPTTTPLGSSILDHAKAAGNVNDDTSHWGLRNNAGLWNSYNCLDLLVPTPTCPDPLDSFNKTFDGATWTPAFEFAVHGGVQCNPVGLDLADQMAEVKRVFEASEGKGIERALVANRFTERDLTGEPVTPLNRSNRGEWDGPVDITPGVPVNAKIALALLEGYAAIHYVGVPTIHMPRTLISVISDMVQWRDNGLAYTPAGSKIAVGGGYDSDDQIASGQFDMYATGEVYIERAEKIDATEYVVPGDGSGVGLGKNGLVDNTVITLAERQYRVAVDCFVAKATATIFG